MTTRLGLALLLLLASPALAQEPEVLLDAWSEHWVAGRKAAWRHARIDSPGPGRLLLVERTWTALDDGELVTREEQVQTDGAGKLLRYSLTEDAPWGPITAKAELADGKLAWRAQVRAAKVREGTLEGELWSPAVVKHLMLRGRLPAEKRTVRALDLPGPGARDATFEVVKEGDGWRVDQKETKEWYDAAGRFVRGEHTDRADERWLPAASQRVARDLTASPPAGAPAAVTVAEGPGLRLRRPASRGWSMARTQQGGMQLAGLEHASELGLFVMGLPMRLPKEEKALLAMAEQMRGGMNKSSTARGEGPVLAPGVMSTWRDRPAVRYPIGGTIDMEPAVGEAFLLDLDGRTVLIMTAGPADLAEANRERLAAALAGLELTGEKAEPAWERVQLDGASVELPVGWKEKKETGERLSALGASRVKLTRGQVPPGADMSQAQRLWVSKNEQNPAFTDFAAGRDEEVELDGRTVRVVEWTALMKAQGQESRVRSASCLALQDGAYAELVIVGFEMDLDLATIDRIIRSLRWTETR